MIIIEESNRTVMWYCEYDGKTYLEEFDTQKEKKKWLKQRFDRAKVKNKSASKFKKIEPLE